MSSQKTDLKYLIGTLRNINDEGTIKCECLVISAATVITIYDNLLSNKTLMDSKLLRFYLWNSVEEIGIREIVKKDNIALITLSLPLGEVLKDYVQNISGNCTKVDNGDFSIFTFSQNSKGYELTKISCKAIKLDQGKLTYSVEKEPIKGSPIMKLTDNKTELLGFHQDYSNKLCTGYLCSIQINDNGKQIEFRNSDLIKAFKIIGTFFISISKFDESEAYFNEATKIEIKTDDDKLENADVNNMKGILYSEKKDYQNSIDYLEKARSVLSSFKDKKYYYFNSFALAYVSFMKSKQTHEEEKKSSQILFDDLEEQKKKLENQVNIIQCLENLGHFFRKIGRIQRSISFYEQSIDLREISKLYDDSLLNTYCIVGNLNNEISFFKRSLEIFKRLLNFLSQTKVDTVSKALCCNNIAMIYQNCNKYEKALEYHMLSLEIFQKLGDNFNISKTYDNIGINYNLQELQSTAIFYLTKALSIKKEYFSENKIELIMTHYYLGNTYNSKQDLKNTILNYEEVMKLVTQIDEKDDFMFLKVYQDINSQVSKNSSNKVGKEAFKMIGLINKKYSLPN